MSEEQTQQTEENNDNKHYKHYRKGTVVVTRWENVKKHEGNKENSVWNSYTVQRSYQVEENEKKVWKNTSSLRDMDLLVVSELLREAYKDNNPTTS